MSNTKFRLSFFSFFITSLLLVTVQAQEGETATANLPAVNVKGERDDATFGSSQKKVTSKQLEQNQAEDLEDVFRLQPEITVGGGQRAAQKVYVRGLQDTNLNVTIDGARQSGQLFHHQGRINIEPELLKEIDVEAGTGNALAGPGALGGRLNFVTKDVEDLLRDGQSHGVFLKGRYNTNNDEKGLSLGLFGKPADSVGILLYGTLAESIDYRAGEGESVPYTAAKPKSALAKVTVRPTQYQKLTASAVRREDNARRLLRAEFGAGATNPPNDQIFETETYTLAYDYVPETPWVDLRAEVYNNRGFLKQSDAVSSSDASISSYGVNLRNTFSTGDFKLTLGSDLNLDRTEANRAAGRQSEQGEVFGGYSQLTYKILPAWSLGAGVRYDQYTLRDILDQSLSKDRFNPNIGTRYFFSDEFALSINWSQAFKGPTPIEAYVVAGAQGVAPNTALEGTIAETSEIKLKYEDDCFNAEAVGFTTLLRSPIQSGVERSGLRRAYRRNVSDIWVRGVNLATSYKINQWSGGLSYALNDLEAGADSDGYKGVGDRIVASIGYQVPDVGLIFGWNTLLSLRIQDAPTGQSEQPGYDIHDVNVTYIPTDRIRVGLALSNIFDAKYVAHGTSYFTTGNFVSMYEPGRDLRFSASYLF